MADNYPIKDGTGTGETFASKSVGGVQHPLHIQEGLFAAAPTAVNMTVSGAFDVSLVAAIPAGANTIGTVNLGSLSGAATAAKQPAFGTAGSASTDVITVQGIASGTPQPISASALPLPSGAATSAKQPALGTAGSASTDVITVQGIASGTPQPVSAASLPLPSGASTAAKQPALGTAGTASADVLSVQGIASMTPFKTVLYNSSGVEIDFTATSPVTQSGTWTVQIGNTPNTTAIKVDGSAVTQPVSIASAAFDVVTTITRPANVTAYTAGDVLGGALDLGTLGPSGAAVMVTSIQLEADIAAVPSGQTTWSLHLYNVTPNSALADNAAWDLPSGDRASYLGQITLTTLIDQGSTLYVESNAIFKQLKLSGTHLFGYLVTVGGFTPNANSEVYKATVHTVSL